MKVIKIIFLTSLPIAIIMSVLLLTGAIHVDPMSALALDNANQDFEAGEYDKAKEAYMQLAEKRKYRDVAHYNQGLISYIEQDYQLAIKEFGLVTEGYKALGNALYRAEDYQGALEQYLLAMKNDSQDMNVKFNYEWTKKKLEEQEKQEQDQQQEQDQNQDQNKDGENQDQQNQDKEDQNQQQQNQNEQNQKDGQNQQDQEQQNQDQQDQNQNDSQDQQSQGQQNESEDKENKDGENKDSGAKEGENPEAEENAQVINQILKMLEQQEKQALKNNQAVRDGNKGERYDW